MKSDHLIIGMLGILVGISSAAGVLLLNKNTAPPQIIEERLVPPVQQVMPIAVPVPVYPPQPRIMITPAPIIIAPRPYPPTVIIQPSPCPPPHHVPPHHPPHVTAPHTPPIHH